MVLLHVVQCIKFEAFIGKAFPFPYHQRAFISKMDLLEPKGGPWVLLLFFSSLQYRNSPSMFNDDLRSSLFSTFICLKPTKVKNVDNSRVWLPVVLLNLQWRYKLAAPSANQPENLEKAVVKKSHVPYIDPIERILNPPLLRPGDVKASFEHLRTPLKSLKNHRFK
jgi:hypothetical protein